MGYEYETIAIYNSKIKSTVLHQGSNESMDQWFNESKNPVFLERQKWKMYLWLDKKFSNTNVYISKIPVRYYIHGAILEN